MAMTEQFPELQDTARALMQASQALHGSRESLQEFENLVHELKQRTLQERVKGRLDRRMFSGLQNLLQYLELQLERAHKVLDRRGIEYYLSILLSSVLGNEMDRIAASTEAKLKIWLDLQRIEHLVKSLGYESEEDQIETLSRIEGILTAGYDPQIQEIIISARLVETLSSLLDLKKTSALVQKEVAIAVSAVVYFNKDIFVGLVLLTNILEKLLNLLNSGFNELDLVLLCVLSRLTLAGKTAIVDEIQAKGGVKKIANMLDMNSSIALQKAAMECLLEMAYHGRKEAVDTMLEQDVVEKLARLQRIGEIKTKRAMPSESNSDSHLQTHPFANAVARFCIQLGVGRGLRQRERTALKLEVLRRIKEAMPNDAESADITAEVLWAP